MPNTFTWCVVRSDHNLPWHGIFKDRAFKMILTDLLSQIFLAEKPSAGFAPFQAAVDSCYSPFAHTPLAKGRTGYLNFSESAMREVIKSQQLNSGERKKRWSDRHRSHTGLNSSRTLSQYINAVIPHHNFYPALVIAYLLSKKELPFVEITAFFSVKNRWRMFCISPLEGLVTFCKCCKCPFKVICLR